MTISALFATISLVLVRAGWMRVVSASCLVSASRSSLFLFPSFGFGLLPMRVVSPISLFSCISSA